MRPIKTMREALEAIDRGVIVDQAENGLPYKVVEALRNRAFGNNQYCYWSHVRYEGSREIWWFCQ